jgi:hypothetical protein
MEPDKAQALPIPTLSPATDTLLEHGLVNHDQNAKKTHALLEHHLVSGDKNAKQSQSLAENQLEVQGRILKELQKPEEPEPEIRKVELVGAELVTIKGEKGDKGDKGDTGERGEKGDQGIQGEKGMDSTIPGPKGDKGDQGPAGKDGKDALDGKDGVDGKNGRDGNDGKDGSPDTAEDIVAKHQSLPPEKRISFNDLKDAPQFPKMAGTGYLREITDVNTLGLAHGQVLIWNANTNKWEPGTAAGVTPKRYNLSTYLNGSTKTFTIPANIAIVSIHSSSDPFIFDDADYSGSGTTTLTFGAGIDAPSMLASGQTIIVIYY